MKEIVLFGGTFSPIHYGHLEMIEAAYEYLKPDEFWVMPAGIPPHKEISGNATTMDRIHMVEIAIRSLPYVRLETSECHKFSRSYTYETLEQFQNAYPDYHFTFLIGEDSLDTFDSWVHPEIISELSTIAVCGRSTSEFDVLEGKCRALQSKFSGKFVPIPMNLVPVSSSEVREYLKNGDSDNVRAMIPEDVLSYITEHHLYQEMQPLDFDEISLDLKKRLKKSRYQHTLGVMYTCGNLAMRYSYPMQKAMLAGLLHDCAKYMSDEELMNFCKKHDIEVTEQEIHAPHLLHAKVGAYFATKRYDIEDEEVLHAILVHTTGCPNMNLLDKILFTADYIEPNRDKAPNLTEIRARAYENLDEAVLMILRDTLSYLEKNAAFIDDMTKITYEFYNSEVTK